MNTSGICDPSLKAARIGVERLHVRGIHCSPMGKYQFRLGVGVGNLYGPFQSYMPWIIRKIKENKSKAKAK